MLNNTIRILNFDDSIVSQLRLISRYKTEIVDLKDLGPGARYWLDKKAGAEVEKRIRSSAKDSITFLGSGDFHHITSLLVDQFDEELCVIVFDFHPDWDIRPPRLGCGSWVNKVLENKNILKFILIGVSSGDISSFRIQTANLGSLKDDRVEIYPYSHAPTLAFFKKIPENLSVRTKNFILFSRIYWNELKNVNLVEFFLHILRRLPAKRVYVSIDKDCLRNEYALTNWEEGRMSLEELLLVLKMIKDNLDIAGVDITGDYSREDIKGRFKRIAVYLDRPKNIRVKNTSESNIAAVNEATNLKILSLLNS